MLNSTSIHTLLVAQLTGVVLVDGASKDWFEGCLRALTAHPKAEDLLSDQMAAPDDFWPDPNDWRAAFRPYKVQNGVLQIPVQGVLLNRFGYQVGRYATGYQYIEKALERGLADGAVKGIAFVTDSPGGMVSGNFELVDKIYGARGEKPMRAFAADSAYSAAYSIASAADSISVTRSGGVGSIGVLTSHIDFSKALDKAGIKITFIHAGKHKVDGNPYEPLPKAVKDRIQQRIDKSYAVFTGTVARNRDMDEKDVRATEALTYDAEAAIEVKLADSVGSFEEDLAAFEQDVSSIGDNRMATQEKLEVSVSQAKYDADVASAKTEGEKTGATAERTRINSILGSDEAKARPKAALSAALKTDMTVEQAKAFLGDLPEEKAEVKAPEQQQSGQDSAFQKAMNGGDNPNVGAGSDQGNGGPKDDAALSATILSDYRGASGKPKQEKKTA